MKFFVTGTDTGVGKTVASAWLVQHFKADYWKPIQSGITLGTDTGFIRRVLTLPETRIHLPTYEFRDPLSPHQAARNDNKTIKISSITMPETSQNLIVEGAGGLLVPLNEKDFMIDLIKHLGLPVILVARTILGTINHTLLSLEALRARHIPIAGLILNGEKNVNTIKALQTYGNCPILAHIPVMNSITAETLKQITPCHDFSDSI